MRMKTLAMNILTALLLAATSTAGAQDLGMAYASDGTLFYGGSWYHHRNPEGQPTQIYRMDPSGKGGMAQPGGNGELVIWNGGRGISDLSLSADGQLVAFREHRFDENVGATEGNYTTRVYTARGERELHHFEDSVLKVITRDGVELLSIPRVRAFRWSRSKQHIAYLTGDYFEGGLGFVSTGTWIVDAGGFSPTPVQAHSSGYDVAWAHKGNAFYIWDMTTEGSEVLYYKVNKNTLSASQRQGVHFSPSGTYYYRPSYEGNDFQLYEKVGNKDITTALGWFASAHLRLAQPVGWIDDVHLIVRDGDEDLLINVAEGYGLKSGGLVLGRDSNTNDGIVIFGAQGLETASISNLTKVYPTHPED